MTRTTDNSDVPFRLLGFAADPDKASNLCGGTFARYAAAGTEVTLVCAATHEWSSVDRAAVHEVRMHQIHGVLHEHLPVAAVFKS